MNKYELTLAVDGKGGAARMKKVTETLEKVLKVLKGKTVSKKDWGNKDLAYRIGKSTTGYYTLFNLELEASSVKSLNEKLRTDADIMRYLLVKTEK